MAENNEDLTFRPDIATINMLLDVKAMLTVSLNIQSDLLAHNSGKDNMEVRKETWDRVATTRKKEVEAFEESLRNK
ncbi:hypothetical protein [Hymenobacter wooponensis]|uniref:Uncharacterized protein n=1 Tax=Hymenobacter wooponensis TaxID=1525360 RepID=A0A4Z0MTS0_9BACT|nr:hypothetical protein [Hymenobacter wooponensis]TGD82869.1 hypothetical protein EU557_03555 [Hymenobacter wooponensis]